MTTKQDSGWTLGDAPLPRPGARALVVLAGLAGTVAVWASILSALS